MHQSGLDRARWLAELAEALAAARKLAALHELHHPPADGDARALAAKFAQVIAEVNALRRGGGWRTNEELVPKRMNLPAAPRKPTRPVD